MTELIGWTMVTLGAILGILILSTVLGGDDD
jgi:hypothetical protein